MGKHYNRRVYLGRLCVSTTIVSISQSWGQDWYRSEGYCQEAASGGLLQKEKAERGTHRGKIVFSCVQIRVGVVDQN